MSKQVVIVESPAKARTIGKMLGAEYDVQSSMGHVRDLPEGVLGVDVQNSFKPTYRPTKGRKNVIQGLNKAANGAEAIYLATDPDREGEAIAWHLAEMLRPKAPNVTFNRVSFHEITPQAVHHAFESPSTIDMNLVNAQQARRVLDRIVGYKVSPLLWKDVNHSARSAGRVQSVALRLICERDAEITAFVPREYWNFIATFRKPDTGETFSARLRQLDGVKIDINNAEAAQSVYDGVLRDAFSVATVADTPKQKRPSPPFITSTLQQAASANLRFGTHQTMMLAQQLYEGIDIGSGPVGLITYMRTDSVTIAATARDAAAAYIRAQFGTDYVPAKPNVYRSKKGAQEAHEAIRPTDVTLTPDKVKGFLEPQQLQLYRLIWNRFLASQMAPAQLVHHSVELQNQPQTDAHAYLFEAAADRVVFPGFMRVYDLEDVEQQGEKEASERIPALTVGESCALQSLDKQQKFTEPPPRFSEAMLVRELENNGVGRPSTYASIVNTIQLRKYVKKQQGKLHPTPLGITVCQYLTGNLANLFDIQFTAQMEDELDQVEQGTLDWTAMLAAFYERFTKWIDAINPVSVPSSQDIAKLMAIVPESIAWTEPTRRGRRVYDDKKFFHSLRQQLEKGKNLTGKQWHALLMMLAQYEEHLPSLRDVAEALGVTAAVDECRRKRQEIAAQSAANGEPDGRALRLCEVLERVQKWEEPTKRRNRTYDDQKFFRSIAEQAKSGKKLSEAQLNALKNLVVRYKEQIQDAEAVIAELGLASDAGESNGEVAAEWVALAGEIKTFRVKQGKNRRFDEKSFIDSLARQFATKQRLSDRQVRALRKIVTQYSDQIVDFDKRTAALEAKTSAAPAEATS